MSVWVVVGVLPICVPPVAEDRRSPSLPDPALPSGQGHRL